MSARSNPVASSSYDLNEAADRFDAAMDFTVGIEEEFQLLDPDSLELTHRFEELERTARKRLGTFVRGELIASEIEVCTDQCNDVPCAASEMLDKRRGLFEAAARLGITLGASGTHPFADWKDQRILDTTHYRIVEERLRYCAWRNTTFGMHVHVGVQGHERIIAIFNALRGYLPQLLALSANSPFAEGRYTYLHSTRTQLFTKFFPRCNIPGPFNGWDDYANYIDTLFAAGSIDEITQVWWSIRPHPLFGTLEIRICDCQSDLRDTLAISALITALVARLTADYDEGKPLGVLTTHQVEENFWRAIRYGLDGGLVDYQARAEIPTRQAVSQLLEYTSAAHAPMSLSGYIDRVDDILINGNGAQRQIRMLEDGHDIASIHRAVVGWTQPHNWAPLSEVDE